MLRKLLFLVLLLHLPPAFSEQGRLTVGTYLGLHKPALEDLNKHEFNSPISGLADVIQGTGVNQTNKIVFPNPLPEFPAGVDSGLEFIWHQNEKYDFIVGGSTWETTSRALTKGGLFLQGQPANVYNERTAKLSYNEYYFGLRYNLIRSPKKFKGYYRLTLNEVFDIDYREDLVFLFTSGDAAGVKKSIILQSQATGLLMLQPGFGMEYAFNDMVSMGVEASYLFGFRQIALRDGKSNVDFLSTDNLSLWLPQRVDPDTGNLQYLSEQPVSDQDYNAIRLDFDGWKMLFKLNINF